jgi:phospholipase/lecithinase/hemolysin
LIGNACVDEFNDVAISFNQKAASLVETLKPRLPGLKMAYIDIYDKLLDIIKNPSKYGNILALSDPFVLE